MYKIIITFFLIAFPLSVNADCDFRTPTDCYSCDAPNAIAVGTKENCTKICPNRITNNNGSGTGIYYHINCVLKNCPPDKPFRNYYGSCISSEKGLQNAENNLHLMPEQHCPADSPLQQWNNECFPCDTPEKILISSDFHKGRMKELESVCPNRSILSHGGGNPSSVLNCPSEKPLIDTEGLCYSCNEEMAVNLRFNTRFCARFCDGKRYLDGYLCSRCPEDKSALDEKQCQECGGSFTGNKCL